MTGFSRHPQDRAVAQSFADCRCVSFTATRTAVTWLCLSLGLCLTVVRPVSSDAQIVQQGRTIAVESFVVPQTDRASSGAADQAAALWRCQMRAQIIDKVRIPGGAIANAMVAYVVLFDANGRIEDMQLWKKSGDYRWDSEVARAIRATEPMRLPADPDMRERVRKISVVLAPGRMDPRWPAVEPRNIEARPAAESVVEPSSASERFGEELSRAIGARTNLMDYPAEARARRWEGTTYVRVTFDESGAARGISVVESSGHLALDVRAIAIVKRAKIPPMPQELREKSASVQVPIAFRLTELGPDCTRSPEAAR